MTSAADQRRFQRLQEIGCLACRRLGGYRPPDMHHLLSGGRRRGNSATIPLCEYHHRGVPFDGMTLAEARRELGPSLAGDSRAFHVRFGTDEELLDLAESLLGAAGHARNAKDGQTP